MISNLQFRFVFSLLWLSVFAFAQAESNDEAIHFTCGYDEVEANLQNNIVYQRQQDEYHRRYRQYIRDLTENGDPESGVVYTIPVVVHIITDGSEPLGSRSGRNTG